MNDAIHRKSITWLALFVIVVFMFLKLPPMVARQDALHTTYRTLVEVDALAKKSYVEPIEAKQLVEGALRGMMLKLDPYSGYIPADRLDTLKRHSAGELAGVGIEIGLRHGVPVVIAPLEGSPAALAGVLPGDRILSIDGQSTDDLSVFEIDGLLNGRPGGSAHITVERPGSAASMEFEIESAPVALHSVRGFARASDGHWNYIADPAGRIAYIRISTFLKNTPAEFDAALSGVLDMDARGLILDLRFNPGGLTDAGVAIVDRFVSAGSIISTVSRLQVVTDFPASPDTAAPRIPLVVLVNGASASSAEIVAGALQDHLRAKIVGTRTFGKGSVQHLIELQTMPAAIKLTVAHYRLPGGRIIHRTNSNIDTNDWGIIPDEVVTLTEEEQHAIRDARHEVDLAHLNFLSSKTVAGQSSPGGEHATPAVLIDRQLERALSLLRTMIAEQD